MTSAQTICAPGPSQRADARAAATSWSSGASACAFTAELRARSTAARRCSARSLWSSSISSSWAAAATPAKRGAARARRSAQPAEERGGNSRSASPLKAGAAAPPRPPCRRPSRRRRRRHRPCLWRAAGPAWHRRRRRRCIWRSPRARAPGSEASRCALRPRRRLAGRHARPPRAPEWRRRCTRPPPPAEGA
eukprot:scaffold68149_cov54-Phaeocystis_antarctica.AAC.1